MADSDTKSRHGGPPDLDKNGQLTSAGIDRMRKSIASSEAAKNGTQRRHRPPRQRAHDSTSAGNTPPTTGAQTKTPSVEGSQILAGHGVYDDEPAERTSAAARRSLAEQETNAGEKNAGSSTIANEFEEAITSKIDDAVDEFKEKRERSKTKVRHGPFKSTRAKISLFFATIGAVASIVATIAFLPTWAMNQLQDKVSEAVGDRVGYAMRETAKKIINQYIVQQVFPSQEACDSRIIRTGCYASTNSGTLGELFGAWKKNRMDLKMQSRYGLSFVNNNGEIEVFKNGESLGIFGRRAAGSRIVTNVVTDAFMKESRSIGVRDRWLIRHALRSQYGAKFCLFLCEERDALEDRFSPLRRLTLKIAARITTKYDARLGALLICGITSCRPEDLDRKGREGTKRALRDVDKELLEQIGKELDDSGKRYSSVLMREIIQKTLSKELAEKILANAGIKTATQAGSRAIPAFGTIMFAIDIALAFDYFETALEKNLLSNYLFETNLALAIEQSVNIDTCVDESQSLLPFNNDREVASLSERAACFQYVRNFGSSRLYQRINGISPKSRVECAQPTRTTVQLESDGFNLDDLFNGALDLVRVPDESKQAEVLQGEEDPLVCPEKFMRPDVSIETLRASPVGDFILSLMNPMSQCAPTALLTGGIPIIGSYIGNSIEDLLNAGCGPDSDWRAANVIRRTKGLVDGVLGRLAEVAIAILGEVPGLGDLMRGAQDRITEFTEENFGKFATALMSVVTDFWPASTRPVANEGSERTDQYIAGKSAEIYTFAKCVPDEDDETKCVGLRAGAPSPEQAAKLDVAIAEEKHYNMMSKSILARYFDLSDHTSLASTLLLNVASTAPIGGEPLGFGINPMDAFSNIGSLFSLNKKAAAQGLPSDRSSYFGIPDYYFTLDELDSMNIEEMIPSLEQQQIEEQEASIREIPITNPFTGTVHAVEAPEKGVTYSLFKTTELTMYKIYDPDTEEEYRTWLSTLQGQELDSPTGSGGEPIGAGSATECAPNTTFVEVAEAHAGTRVTICRVNNLMNVNASISGAVKALLDDAKAAGVTFGGGSFRRYADQIALRKAHCGTSQYAIYQMPASQCRPPTARPGQSMHELGLAIDFTYNGRIIGSRSGAGYNWLAANASRYGLKNLPSEPWHWSTNGK